MSRPVTFEIGGSPEIAYGNFPDRRRFQIYTRSRSTVASCELGSPKLYAGFAKRPWSLASARHSGFRSLPASLKARRTPSALKSLA